MPQAADEAEGALYAGGAVRTGEPGAPLAEALATRGGRILEVGSRDACRAALAEAKLSHVREVDLRGRALLPGFIDTHLHPIPLLFFDLHADLSGVTSLNELTSELRRAGQGLGEDEWLVGLRLQPEALRERRLPRREELDAVDRERPVVVLGHDGHSASGNGAALAAAGLTALRADPQGGRIERDADGTPTGVCLEGAAQALLGAIPTPSVERLRATGERSFARLAACGITSAGVVLQTDAEGPAGEAGSLEAFALGVLADVVPFCTYAILVGRSVDAALAARQSPLHDPARGRRVGGFKIFVDGTFGSTTARLREPFADAPCQHGMLTLGEDEILERMRAAHAAGLQICVHTVGDAAIERALDLFERVMREAPRPDPRHRLEHASLAPPDLVKRMAGLGVAVSTQPLFIHSEKAWLRARLGPERAAHVYPLRSFLDAGVRVGGASDAPVESPEVLRAIQCCVTREGFEPAQAISPAEALDLFTRSAAAIQHEEHEKGTLAPGKRADLVVLSDDPLAVAPERIAALRVLRSVVGGRDVFDAQQGDLR